jgi:hypothetical protein
MKQFLQSKHSIQQKKSLNYDNADYSKAKVALWEQKSQAMPIG